METKLLQQVKVRLKCVRQEVFELPLLTLNRKSFTLVASHKICILYGSLRSLKFLVIN